MLKKFFTIKGIIIVSCIIGIFVLLSTVLIAIFGYSTAEKYVDENVADIRVSAPIINNQLYEKKYKKLLNKYLKSKGYVSLERIIFYLQRTNNILDTSILDDNVWEQAYLDNISVEEKQMIPIRQICKKIENDESLTEFSLENGVNQNGIEIEVIDLCNVDSAYEDSYLPLIFFFPLKNNFSITSILFENRNVDLDLAPEEIESVNFHTAWDFSAPVGTSFYSVCNGTIKNITNTQDNDLPFGESGNKLGNYIQVTCNNGFLVQYNHIQYMSTPENLKEGSEVSKGELLGRTSTTGMSTGGHLHLELRDTTGKILDVLQYIDFDY